MSYSLVVVVKREGQGWGEQTTNESYSLVAELRLAAQGEIMVHEMSLTSFLMTGLELEE